jgi:foldase protein PrsA
MESSHRNYAGGLIESAFICGQILDQSYAFRKTAYRVKPNGLSSCLRLTALLLVGATGCVSPAKPPTDTLTLAIQERANNPPPNPAPSPARRKSAATRPDPAPKASPNSDAIATVGGTAISRDEFESLLIRSRGVPVLEQLIGLAAAEEFAQKRGVGITDADMEFEYDLALRRLSDPLAFHTTEGFDQADAERLLDSILVTRYLSRPEFMLTVRRNAFLRNALTAELIVSDEQLQAEYDLAYGDRVQVRHIQLGNLTDAARIKERLTAGEDFADLAARYSTNVSTVRRGGLLDAFSIRDEHIPLAMRQTASKLIAGEVSDVVRVGEWYHLLKLEKHIPAEKRDFESVRDVLQKRIEIRLTDARMRDLHEKLFEEAAVQISDPLLREAYQAAHRSDNSSR